MSLFGKQDRKVKQVLFGSWYQWEEEDTRKGYRVVNIMEILCSQV
jgi:hypothetical protein